MSIFDLRAISGPLNSLLGRYTIQNVDAPTVTGFSPTTGGPSSVVTITGTNFINVSGVRFGGALTLVFTVNSSTELAATVPIGAVTGLIEVITPSGTGQSSTNFTVGASILDGPATIRRANFVAWEQDAYGPVPDWSTIPVQRRVTVASNTWSAFTDAVNAAAALTGGPRLVIVPNGFRATGRIMPPDNADINHPIHIAWESIVNGSYTITRGVRVPIVPPTNAPLLETRDEGSSRLGPVFSFGVTLSDSWVDAAAQSNYRMWGLHIRVREDCPIDRVCDTLVYNGWGFDPLPFGTSAQYPSKNVFSHCWMGGRAFRPDGTWYQTNLARLIRNAGKEFALIDSVDIEHGSNGGSDQGIYSSTIAQGPTLIRNLYSDFGGGISFLNGGADHSKEPWPNDEDFELSYSLIVRDEKYHPTEGQQDTAGNRCQWLQKNQFETKNAGYWRCHRNVFLNHWTQGQNSALIIKAVNQGGNGRFDSTYDIAVTENIVIVRPSLVNNIAFTVSGLETYGPTNGGTTNLLRGVRRMQVRDNVFVGTRHVENLLGSAVMRLIMAAPAQGQEPGGWWSFVNNLLDVHPAFAQASDPHMSCEFGVDAVAGTFTFSRNVFPGLSNTSAGNGLIGVHPIFGGLPGIDNMLSDEFYINNSAAIITRDNAFRTSTGLQPTSNWTTYGPSQLYFSSMAAMGITRTSPNTLDVMYSYESGSPLLTGAQGGARIGPDLALLLTLRPAITSGDIRSVI